MSQETGQVDQLAPDASPAPEAAGVKKSGSSVSRLSFVFFNIAAVLALLLMFEGAASTYYAFRNTFAAPPVAESLYTQYDPELGWVNLPNVYLPNMYGPGKFLRTNSQRFRNDADFTRSVPAGKARVICSGDSFTFGFGVDNEHNWPQLLAGHAPNLETVNMGQGGYGADQAYLWYKRDGAALEHNVQILALIYPDLYRMQHSSFNNYGKPVLTVENEHVVAGNVPVPRSMVVRAPRLVQVENALSTLAITRLLRSTLHLDNAAPRAPSEERNEQTVRVLTYMLDDLAATNRTRNSTLVLAYLPIREELGWKSAGYWRGVLADYARAHGILYIDLSDDFRRLAPAEADKLFIPNGAVDALGAAGHYNEAGNAYVADLIYQKLLANPEIAAKLHAN